MEVSKVEFDNSDLKEQQPVMAVKGELVFLDHFNRIINERDDDIDIGQLGYENYQALELAALDAFRATMLQEESVNTPPIPNGWKLVPIDPTKDMLRAGQSVVGFWLNTVHCYSKMLAAAPAAPQQEMK